METNEIKPEENKIQQLPDSQEIPLFQITEKTFEIKPDNNMQELSSSQEIPLSQITEKTFENLKDKIPEDKIEAVKSMKKRYFLKEELSQMLEKLNFSKEEIDIISSSAQDLDKDTFMKRYGMTPGKYREWKEPLVAYKDNPSE